MSEEVHEEGARRQQGPVGPAQGSQRSAKRVGMARTGVEELVSVHGGIGAGEHGPRDGRREQRLAIGADAEEANTCSNGDKHGECSHGGVHHDPGTASEQQGARHLGQ